MNQLEERRYYEEEDEIDLLELVHTMLKHKFMIIIVTLLVTVIATLGGYLYNRSNTINKAIIGFNYPELQDGKNPDGSIFSKNNIIPLDVIIDTYEIYKEELNVDSLDEFRSTIRIEAIISEATKTRIENALKNGENISYTASNYEIINEVRNKEILTKMIEDSVSKYIKSYKPTYTIQTLEDNIFDYDYSDAYNLLNERVKMMEMNIATYENKSYMSSRLGYSFDMISERIKNFKNIELQDYYSYYMANNFSKNKNTRLVRINSNIQELLLENQSLEGKGKILKEMLQELKPTQKQVIIPNIPENGININNGEEEDYYSKLVADYVELNNKIEDNKVNIILLEKSKQDIKQPSSEDIKLLEEKLNVSVKKINSIIEDMNKLSEEYVDVTYSNMIKVISPVRTTTNGKPLILFLGVGVVLGGMLGIFLAFMKEFAKNYKARYSK